MGTLDQSAPGLDQIRGRVARLRSLGARVELRDGRLVAGLQAIEDRELRGAVRRWLHANRNAVIAILLAEAEVRAERDATQRESVLHTTADAARRSPDDAGRGEAAVATCVETTPRVERAASQDEADRYGSDGCLDDLKSDLASTTRSARSSDRVSPDRTGSTATPLNLEDQPTAENSAILRSHTRRLPEREYARCGLYWIDPFDPRGRISHRPIEGYALTSALGDEWAAKVASGEIDRAEALRIANRAAHDRLNLAKVAGESDAIAEHFRDPRVSRNPARCATQIRYPE